MADFYGAGNGKSFWHDAPVEQVPTVPAPSSDASAYGAAEGGQRPPIVQPLIIVPYASQMQPLYQYTPEAMNAYYNQQPYSGGYDGAYGEDYYGGQNYIDDGYTAGYAYEPQTSVRANRASASKTKGRANAAAIVALILGLLAAAVMVVSHFVDMKYLYIIKDTGALKILMGLPDLFKGDIDIKQLVFPVALALCALFTVLCLLTNLFSVGARRYPVAGKAFGVIAALGAAAALVMLFVNKEEIEIGAYILTGLAVLTMIVCLAGKRRV